MNLRLEEAYKLGRSWSMGGLGDYMCVDKHM